MPGAVYTACLSCDEPEGRTHCRPTRHRFRTTPTTCLLHSKCGAGSDRDGRGVCAAGRGCHRPRQRHRAPGPERAAADGPWPGRARWDSKRRAAWRRQRSGGAPRRSGRAHGGQLTDGEAAGERGACGGLAWRGGARDWRLAPEYASVRTRRQRGGAGAGWLSCYSRSSPQSLARALGRVFGGTVRASSLDSGRKGMGHY